MLTCIQVTAHTGTQVHTITRAMCAFSYSQNNVPYILVQKPCGL